MRVISALYPCIADMLTCALNTNAVSSGNDVLPAMWGDNFFTLLSGSSMLIELEYEAGRTVDHVTAVPFNTAAAAA